LGEQYFVGRGGGECVGVKKGVGSEKKWGKGGGSGRPSSLNRGRMVAASFFWLAKVGGCPFSDWVRWEASLVEEEKWRGMAGRNCHAYTFWPAPFLPNTSEQCERYRDGGRLWW
jgi:hypothetical protein